MILSFSVEDDTGVPGIAIEDNDGVITEEDHSKLNQFTLTSEGGNLALYEVRLIHLW